MWCLVLGYLHLIGYVWHMTFEPIKLKGLSVALLSAVDARNGGGWFCWFKSLDSISWWINKDSLFLFFDDDSQCCCFLLIQFPYHDHPFTPTTLQQVTVSLAPTNHRICGNFRWFRLVTSAAPKPQSTEDPHSSQLLKTQLLPTLGYVGSPMEQTGDRANMTKTSHFSRIKRI